VKSPRFSISFWGAELEVQGKRRADIWLAGVLIIFTLPFMAIVALAIKCNSRGPVFSREERIDPRGRRFLALQFRSTAHDCVLDEVRVTRVGQLLRYTRIDCLPRLINVLRGDMSFDASWEGHFLD
jgi:lipopolysaccharide/colanic/teichoic acid biosynthesis glycosyltransferase